MEAWQQRVVEERNELHHKLVNLGKFMEFNSHFNELDEREQQLLKQQYGHMELYLDVLNHRVVGFGGT